MKEKAVAAKPHFMFPPQKLSVDPNFQRIFSFARKIFSNKKQTLQILFPIES
jgi:hypothetical protein